mmetsp:Transcript_7814/g.12733  ORF Transcript_7814/g.12733 Transcript_7814/m.12733 type:complete len:161 (+) Transcript_7814:180-662(+)
MSTKMPIQIVFSVETPITNLTNKRLGSRVYASMETEVGKLSKSPATLLAFEWSNFRMSPDMGNQRASLTKFSRASRAVEGQFPRVAHGMRLHYLLGSEACIAVCAPERTDGLVELHVVDHICFTGEGSIFAVYTAIYPFHVEYLDMIMERVHRYFGPESI